jgi:hypothetical protein
MTIFFCWLLKQCIAYAIEKYQIFFSPNFTTDTNANSGRTTPSSLATSDITTPTLAASSFG